MQARLLGRFVLAMSFAAGLAGCGGSQPPIGATSGTNIFDARSLKQVVSETGDRTRSRPGFTYVGQYWSNYINQYPADNRHNRAPACQIPSKQLYPTGMYVDRSGTLYVAELLPGSEPSVVTYAPDCGKAGPTYSKKYGLPEDPVVDNGKLFVSYTNAGTLPGVIMVFRLNGGSDPIGELTDPAAGVGVGVAVDSRHNLFWSTTSAWAGDGQVIEFRNSQQPGFVLKKTRIPGHFPGGVMLDRADNLLFIDQNADKVLVFAPPYKSKPFRTIQLQGSAWYCALGAKDAQLYCLDDNGSVDAYDYASGTYQFSYNNGISTGLGPVGIAVQPSVE